MRGTRWRVIGSVAWRFLRGRRSQLLDSTARSALIATTIGVTAMVVAMALMSGYRQELQQKLVRGSAAVVAYPLSGSGLELSPETATSLRSLPDVDGLRRVAYGQGTLSSRDSPSGVDVVLRGVSTQEGEADPFLAASGIDAGLLAAAPIPGVVVGAELAQQLAALPDEPLRLMVLGARNGRPRFGYRSVRVMGSFATGFSEFDRQLVVLDRGLLEELVGAAVGDAFFEIVVGDAGSAATVAEQARDVLGPEFLVTDWRELNRELFTALKLQQLALFLVLGLIVVVSTFNVASSLVVLVRERMREIGTLAALGLSPRELRRIFLAFGGLLGACGTAAGVGIGAFGSWILTRYELIQFDSEVAAIYFLSSVPFRVEWLDVGAVVAFTLGLTFAACWLPARRAGSVEPAVALRYE